ncbi:MAG: hypothetical protein ACRDFZ_07515 [Candidatus Limnocylindria bacterium]
MFRVLMIVLAAVGVAWGLTALLVPDLLAQLYGGSLEPFGRAFTNVGAAIAVGFGLLDGSLRNLQDSATQRRILLANLVAIMLVAVTLLLSTASGTFNALGWAGAALHSALAAVLLWVLVRASRT